MRIAARYKAIALHFHVYVPGFSSIEYVPSWRVFVERSADPFPRVSVAFPDSRIIDVQHHTFDLRGHVCPRPAGSGTRNIARYAKLGS